MVEGNACFQDYELKKYISTAGDNLYEGIGTKLGMGAHTCNLSCSGGRDGEDCDSRLPQGRS
jgi:hypothetical protein